MISDKIHDVKKFQEKTCKTLCKAAKVTCTASVDYPVSFCCFLQQR